MKFTVVLVGLSTVVIAAQKGCGTGIQSAFARLGDYPPAQSLCQAKYLKTVTLTKREAPSTMTTITTTRSSHVLDTTRHTASRMTKHSRPSPSKGPAARSPKDTKDTAKDDDSDSVLVQGEKKKSNGSKDSLYSSLLAQPSDNISTFCGCNFAPKTVRESKVKTTTARARPMKSSSLTTTTEVTSVTSTTSLASLSTTSSSDPTSTTSTITLSSTASSTTSLSTPPTSSSSSTIELPNTTSSSTTSSSITTSSTSDSLSTTSILTTAEAVTTTSTTPSMTTTTTGIA